MSRIVSDITHGSWAQRQQRVKLTTGIEMAYMEAGNLEGPPLILIHGYTDSGRSWLRTFAHFENDYHIFALDLRGCGASDKPDQFAYTIVQNAEDVVSFIKLKALQNVYVAGHSMGGMVAYTVGFMIPDCVKAIALVATGARLHETPEMVRKNKTVREAMGIDKLPIDEIHPGHLDYPDQENVKYYMECRNSLKSTYFRTAWWGMSLSDQSNFLQFIEAPVLIIWGNRDELFTRASQDEMLKLLPNAKFVEFNNTHEILCEAPDAMAEVIRDFFEDK